jgi:hypothetical protein
MSAGGVTYNQQTRALIQWLRVIHERSLDIPSSRYLAEKVGYKSHKTVHERARHLVRLGVIPEDYWPKHHQPSGAFRARRNDHGVKLNSDLVKQMRERHAQGIGYKRLSREFGVDRRTIQQVVRRETWKHVA